MFLHPGHRHQEGLTQAQLDRARKGFRGMLWRKQFPASFILNDSDDLLAIAHTEMVRAVAKGTEIEDPVGWTITCAYRRTQNLLQAESLRPREVSVEKVSELSDLSAPTPEQLTEDSDRARKVREAVAKLSEDQRKLIALTYFGGMSVREAGRSLNWHSSKVQRCHEAALRTLRRKLPVRSSDELEIIVGLTSWLALDERAGLHLPAGFEAVIEKAGEGAQGLWARAEGLARRLPLGGGEGAAAVSSSGAGRAVGACAAAIGIACFGAGAVVVPSLGDRSPEAAAKERPERSGATDVAPQVSAPAPTHPVTSTPQGEAAPVTAARESRRERRLAAEAAQARAQKREADQVERQTSGFARAASESSGESSEATASASPETVVVPPAPSGASSAEATQAGQQFGAFK